MEGERFCMKGFFKLTVLSLFIVFLSPMDYAGKGEKRGASPISEAREADVTHPSPGKKAKMEEEISLEDGILSLTTSDDGKDPCFDYGIASKTLDLVYENDPGKITKLFNDVPVTNTKTFFLILQVCSYARANALKELQELMFGKLGDRKNLNKLPIYLRAVQRVFGDPDNKDRLSLSAIASHFNELTIIMKLIYLSLKTRPKIDNYALLKTLYLGYNEQLRSL